MDCFMDIQRLMESLEQGASQGQSANNSAALALVKGFRFKNALMEEHFNENYAESNEYPKAVFKGELVFIKIAKSNTCPVLISTPR